MILFQKIVKIFSGSLIAQLLSFVLYPVFSIYFSPEDFGLYGKVTTISTLSSIVFSGLFYMGVVYPKEEREAYLLVVASFLTTFIFSIAATILILVPLNLLGILKLPAALICLIPVFNLCYVASESTRMLQVRRQTFGNASLILAGNKLLSSILKLTLSFMGASGLFLSDIFANVVATLIGIKRLSFFIPKWEWSTLRDLLGRHLGLVKFYLFTTLVQQLIFDLPVFFIGELFDQSVLGYFVLINKLVAQPVWIFAGAVSTALLADFVKSYQEGTRSGNKLYKPLLGCFLFSLLGAGFIYLWADDLFLVFFSSRWKEVAIFLPFAAPLVISRFCSALFFCYLFAHNLHLSSAVLRLFHVCVLIGFGYYARDYDYVTFMQKWFLVDAVCEISLVLVALPFLRKLR